MDKDIIIDGVDVAGCEYYKNGICQWSLRIQPPCEVVKNCYYKQLKRLEQENERLKTQYNCYACGNCKGKEDYINLEKHHIGLRKQFDKKVHTLQEIKEIADVLSCKHPEDCFENKPDWNGEVYGCDVADDWKEPSDLATCPSKLASAILQIITKVEEE